MTTVKVKEERKTKQEHQTINKLFENCRSGSACYESKIWPTGGTIWPIADIIRPGQFKFHFNAGRAELLVARTKLHFSPLAQRFSW